MNITISDELLTTSTATDEGTMTVTVSDELAV
jgi:hypothetical protein